MLGYHKFRELAGTSAWYQLNPSYNTAKKMSTSQSSANSGV